VHSATSRRESEKLVSSNHNETGRKTMTSRTKATTNGEADRLRDVRDENALFLVIDEEEQRTGRHIEVDFQHDYRSWAEFRVSAHLFFLVADPSTAAAAKSD
jgi:hypothetical protein